MTGAIAFTLVGRDAMVQHLPEHITKFRLGEGGFSKSDLVTETIEASASGTQKAYTFVVTGGDFAIINVDTSNDIFRIAGDQRELFPDGAQIKVRESTDNNGTYTVASTTLNGMDTDVEVDEDVTDPTADGYLYVDRLPILKGPGSGQHHHPLAVVEYNGATPVQKLEDTTGTGSLTQMLGGSAGTGTVNYKTGSLSVTFENNVAVGNSVKVEYKYANTPVQPTTAQETLYSQQDSALYTFEKTLTADDFTFRGAGWGTIRATASLTEAEGLDDGTSYGGTPYYFEGALFDEDDVMLCYFTFDKQRKIGSAVIEHTVDIVV